MTTTFAQTFQYFNLSCSGSIYSINWKFAWPLMYIFGYTTCISNPAAWVSIGIFALGGVTRTDLRDLSLIQSFVGLHASCIIARIDGPGVDTRARIRCLFSLHLCIKYYKEWQKRLTIKNLTIKIIQKQFINTLIKL